VALLGTFLQTVECCVGGLLTGLAEAGLISSNLSKTGVVEKGMQSGVFFEPNRYSYIL
jgi:hypothetical protein